MTVLIWAGAITAVCGAAFAVVKLVRGVARTTRRIVYIADTVRELVPNGGTSIKDQVADIAKRLTSLEDALGVKRP